MKKNGNKSLIKLAVVLVGLIIIGSILNMRGSAKEVVEEPEIKAKAELVTVWQTDGHWGESMTRIVEAFRKDYEEVEMVDANWNTDRNRMELTFMTEYGDVTGHIYER